MSAAKGPSAMFFPATASAPPQAARSELLRTAVLMLALLAFTAWLRPLMLPDEGRYAGVAWEMFRSGDWATPLLDGLPFFHKPPLFYWLGAAAMWVLGVNEFAARIGSVVGAWTAAMAMFVFVRHWRGKPLARGTATVLMAQPLFFLGGQFANLDMLVAGCITATILCAAQAVLCLEAVRPFKGALLGAYVFAALGVLAKGLIGLVLPGMVIVAWLIATRRLRRMPALVSFWGIALFLVMAAPWFAVMQVRFPDFLDYFFVVQHFKRFTGTGFNNVQAWWFYPAVLVLAHLFWLPGLYRMFKPRTLAAVRHDPLRALMWVWLLVVVIFFSLPKSKLIGYVLPALPPLAYLLCDSFFGQAGPSTLLRRWWLGASVVAMAVAVATVGWLALQPVKSTRSLALALQDARSGGEPVLMLENYYYDVPFYAKLKQPVVVIDAWTDPKIALNDNWRKEVSDAAAFAPALASRILPLPSQFSATACAAPVTWVIGPRDKANTYPVLTTANVVFERDGVALWRLDRSRAEAAQRLHCAGESHGG